MEKIIELLESFLKTLNELELLNVIFLVLAILSIIISVYLYFKSKREKKPNYILETHNIFKKNKSLKDLAIDYNGTTLDNLSITYVSFWNKGRLTINSSDFVKKDPMRIEFPKSSQILGSEITYRKYEKNDFSIKINQKTNSVLFNFDYLDKNQGFKFRIYHTSTESKDKSNEIKLSGSLKGVRKIKVGMAEPQHYADYIFENTVGYPRKWMNNFIWKIYFILLMPITLLIFFIGTFWATLVFFKNTPNEFMHEKEKLNNEK